MILYRVENRIRWERKIDCFLFLFCLFCLLFLITRLLFCCRGCSKLFAEMLSVGSRVGMGACITMVVPTRSTMLSRYGSVACALVSLTLTSLFGCGIIRHSFWIPVKQSRTGTSFHTPSPSRHPPSLQSSESMQMQSFARNGCH